MMKPFERPLTFDYVTNSARGRMSEEKGLQICESHEMGQDVVMMGLSQNS
jgi:hypothetical protein